MGKAGHQAEAAYRFYRSRNLEWATKFRMLDARILDWRGMDEQVLSLLKDDSSTNFTNSDLEIQKHELIGLSFAHLHQYAMASRELQQAAQECSSIRCGIPGEVLTAQGTLEIERGNYAAARKLFEQSLQSASERKDHFLMAMAFTNLSHVALLQEHFDEAIDWALSAERTARAIHAQLIAEIAHGNLGWGYYETGDSERALRYFEQAEKQAAELDSTIDQARWLTTTGYVYLDQWQYVTAADSYLQALALARKLDSKEEIFNAELSLAFAYVQTGQLDLAKQYSHLATELASQGTNPLNKQYASLAEAEVAAHSGETKRAETIFQQIADVPNGRLSLRWGAQYELANLYAQQNRATDADKTYRAALSTFESARAQLQHEDLKLPFLGNAAHLYDDYVHFLIEQNRTQEALRVADFSRAQTLAEVLGKLGSRSSFNPPALNAQQIAGHLHSAILFYWLGPTQSYLWAITAKGAGLFQLPPASKIDDLVKRYRGSLIGPRDPLAMSDPDGIELYKTLVAPAEKLLKGSSRVVVVPDGSLNNLNFETLLAPKPKLHYWIEDVTLSDASSLRMLAAAGEGPRISGRKLLLIGDPVAPNAEYFELPKAATEIQDIEQHFTPSQEDIFTRAKATPQAYLASKPGQFAYIHFVAHGTASRLSPLDSAVVLSKSTGDADSFKLYARDIIREPLHARLVTISTCYGAGARAYTGEGLVGLSWAFLRAGAHNVIGALWEVSDTSTPQLMNALYGDLRKGESPEESLRNAKLSLLRSNSIFRKPFYWAPFQLYVGP